MHRIPFHQRSCWGRYSQIFIGLTFTGLLLAYQPLLVFSQEETPQSQESSAQEAQSETEEDIPTMEPVVVSATKTPVPVSHLTSAVEVITAETMKERKIKSVTEALQLSQGLVILQSGGPGATAEARIRGAGASQTLVLIDGTIMNSGTLGSYNFANLMVSDIEKIEILRGAQGMLWGADAIGGVINITTKKGKGTPQAGAFFEYGSFASIREGGNVSGKYGPVDLSGSLWRWDIAKFSAVNYRRGALERDAFRNWQANMHMGITLPREGRLDFTYRWINGDTDIDNGTTFGNGPFDVFASKGTNNQYIYAGSYYQPLTSWWDQKLTLSRAQESNVTQAGTDQRSVVTGMVSPSFNTNSEINTLNNRIEWQHNFQVIDPLALNLGYQFRGQEGENISSSGFPNKIISNNAGFAQAQFNLFDRLLGTAGLRHDSFNTFGDATTWRVTGGYLHKESGTKLRASYGTGFRAPTINDLFFPNFGNPDLQPEKTQSWDMALEQNLFRKQLFLSAGYFWNRFNNLILAVFDPEGACRDLSEFGFCAQNIGTARAQGVEANFKFTMPSTHRFLKLLALQGQYTYTLTDEFETGTPLPRWPEHMASALLTYKPIDPVATTVSFRYVGARFNTTNGQQPMPQFTVWDFTLNWQINKEVLAYTRVDNIFDRKYEEVLNFGVPVRSIYFGIRTNFDVLIPGAEKKTKSSNLQGQYIRGDQQ